VYAGSKWGTLREGDHLEHRGVDGRISSKWIVEKWEMGGHGVDRSGSGQIQVAGCCELSNDPSGFIKCGEFLE
jgi:hypothetical protein